MAKMPKLEVEVEILNWYKVLQEAKSMPVVVSDSIPSIVTGGMAYIDGVPYDILGADVTELPGTGQKVIKLHGRETIFAPEPETADAKE